MKLITSLFVLLFFVACQPQTSEPDPVVDTPPDTANSFFTKPYYFPVDDLQEGNVYEYSILQDSNTFLAYYWFLQSQKGEQGEDFLIWKRYNPLFEQDQYIKEWLVKDGVVTTEYELFARDSSQSLQRYINEVEQNIVYPFEAALDSNLAYRFACTMTLPPDFVTVRLVRDRRFLQAMEYVYKGRELPAIAFSCTDLYDLEDKAEGGFWEQKEMSIEIYAEGIGLVYTESKTEGEQASELTVLTNIYTVQEFEALKVQHTAVE
jgi:hypothetical protein